MAEINQTYWGADTDWVDAVQYENDTDEKYRDKWTPAIHELDEPEVGTPWDNTPSYAGLGTESPLSHITNLRYYMPYWNGAWFDGEEFEEILIDSSNTEDREVTRFAFANVDLSRLKQNIPVMKKDRDYLNLSQYSPSSQRWTGNDELLQTNWGGNTVDNWSWAYATKVLAKISVKNSVLVPYVKCLSATTGTIDAKIVDLKTYLDDSQGNTDANISTHPYVASVGIKMVTASDDTDLLDRDRTVGGNSIVQFEETSFYAGINPDSVDPDDYPDEAGLENCYDYRLNTDFNSGFFPIMGLLTDYGTAGTSGKSWGNTIEWTPTYIYLDGTHSTLEDRPDVPELYDIQGGTAYGGMRWAGSEDMQVAITSHPNPENPYQSTANGEGNYMVFYMNPGTKAEFQEKVRHAVACFGMFFVDGEEDQNVALDNDKMMLGILVDGIGHGDYSHGAANRDQDQWNWDDMHENDYDPEGPQPEPGDDPAASDNPLLPVGLDWTLASTGTGIWAVTPSNIDEIWHDIFSHDIKLTQFGDSPMNAIISLEWTPFTWTSNETQPVVLGSSIVNPLHAYPLIKTVTNAEVHGYGQMRFKFNKNFYNARNMQARLFLPFYGYYELPAAQLLSSQLRVDFYYDIPDELGVWVISYDKVIYDFVECNCKIEIPITGSNAAAIRQNKTSEALTIATQVAATVGAVTAGGIGVASSGAVGELSALYTSSGSVGGVLQSLPWIESETAMSLAKGAVAGAATLGAAGQGVKGVYNTVNNARIQRAALRTNLPYHGSALQTTFLHMSMKPYVQIFKNTIMSGLATSEGGTVKVELGGEDEKQYKLKVGHACDIFATISDMPADSLLQTTGLANNSTAGMELSEIQELNAILQSGFLK